MILLLLACAGGPNDTADTAACTGSTGTLRVCVWMQEGDAAPLPGVKAWLATDEAKTDAVETLTGDDGCATFEVEAGEWWAWGEDEAQYCISSPEAVSVAACETTTLDTYLWMGCYDG